MNFSLKFDGQVESTQILQPGFKLYEKTNEPMNTQSIPCVLPENVTFVRYVGRLSGNFLGCCWEVLGKVWVMLWGHLAEVSGAIWGCVFEGLDMFLNVKHCSSAPRSRRGTRIGGNYF